MKSIAVLLTVHNRKEKTLKCLSLLHRQLPIEGYATDIYLTNDGCTDGTPEAIKEAFPEVNIINGDGNLYWNRGMHLAWETASKRKAYDYYLWLNDDTFISNGAVEGVLHSAYATGNQAIIVGATKSEITGNGTYGLRNLETGWPLIPNGQLQEGKEMNGNFVLVPKEVYQQLGNLDPYYHHARGDTDYGLRAKEKGIKIYLHKEHIGICEKHEKPSKWCNPDIPFRLRWQALNHPTGIPLNELFHLEYRHYGVFKALFHLTTTICHCCFPKLWTKYNI